MSDFNSRLPIKGLGLYNLTDNIDPNSTTLVGYTRSLAIDDTLATFRISAAAPNSDNLDPAQIQALDVNSFMHAWDPTGSNWDRVTATSGALNVNVTNSTAAVDVDGVYSVSGPTNTDPDNVGIILHQRATTPADTDQTLRVTGAKPTFDNLTGTDIHAQDVNSFLMGWDGTNWDRLSATAGILNVTFTNTSLNVNVDGIYSGGNTDPDNVGLIVAVRALTPADTDQTLRLTGKNGTVDTTVWSLDVSMHDQNGNAYTPTNPLPVFTVDSPGTEVNDYNTVAAVAAGGTSNHDYTVTAAKTLYLNKIWSSASGKMKTEVAVETGVATGVFVNRFVAFNSTATPNCEVDIKNPIAVAAGVRVRIIRTNRDNQAMDVYSTIEGYELP